MFSSDRSKRYVLVNPFGAMVNRRVVMLSQFSGLVRYVTPCQASDQRSIATHTDLHWHRELPSGRHFLNCGATGRPANDGRAWARGMRGG